jgi:hypothetical protein
MLPSGKSIFGGVNAYKNGKVLQDIIIHLGFSQIRYRNE